MVVPTPTINTPYWLKCVDMTFAQPSFRWVDGIEDARCIKKSRSVSKTVELINLQLGHTYCKLVIVVHVIVCDHGHICYKKYYNN